MMDIQMIDRGDGVRLAARLSPGRTPTIVFLPGYMSDMTGSKATHVLEWARANGQQCLLLDYSGCGASEGELLQGSISRWTSDARMLLEKLAPGAWLPVGSSMGGWVMLELARQCGPRIHGLVGIAAAPDFTEWGLSVTAVEQKQLDAQGFFTRPSAYADSPYRYSRAFLEDAAGCLQLPAPIPVTAPVRLLQGTADDEVPVNIALRLLQQLQSADARLAIIKGGTHRLSEASDLRLLENSLQELLG